MFQEKGYGNFDKIHLRQKQAEFSDWLHWIGFRAYASIHSVRS